jgi:hypothetical protein
LLSVTIRGPWTLDAADMETALEVLLGDLRSRELRPVMDEVVVELESSLMDESARFDGVQVERDVMNFLVREAGWPERSVFDTYDYGRAPPLWMMPSLVAPQLGVDSAP